MKNVKFPVRYICKFMLPRLSVPSDTWYKRHGGNPAQEWYKVIAGRRRSTCAIRIRIKAEKLLGGACKDGARNIDATHAIRRRTEDGEINATTNY